MAEETTERRIIDLFGGPEVIVVASCERRENPNENGIRHLRIASHNGDAYDIDDTWISPSERRQFNEDIVGEVITIDLKRRLVRLDRDGSHSTQLELFELRPDQPLLFDVE